VRPVTGAVRGRAAPGQRCLKVITIICYSPPFHHHGWNVMRPRLPGQTAIVVNILALVLLLGLSGCGQKGNLYLPDQGKTSLVRPSGNP